MSSWGAWLVQALQRPTAPADRERAALHLLDWLGCAHAGQASEEAQPLRRWADGCDPGPVWACGRSGLQRADAVRFHGSLGSLLEMDDVHREAVVHPGDTVIPAALALAQRLHSMADELLDALVIGYETGIRLGLLSGPAHYRHWYSTATTGTFASAMACARLLHLSPALSLNALALAGMQAAGVWQCRMAPGLAKQVATGHSAQAGLLAAELAAAGAAGPASILEGEHGWLQATGCQPHEERARQCLQPAAQAPWLLHGVSFKPWSACRHVHPVIACALQAHAQGVQAAQVAQIEVQTYAVALAFANQPAPGKPHEARFSLQHALAWAWLHGDFGLEASSASVGLADAACAALRARVTVALDEDHERAYPRRFGASVRAVLHDGTRLAWRQDHALGDPEMPLPQARVCAKAEGLLRSAGLSLAQAQGLAAHTLALPGSGSLAPWWARLQALSASSD